MTVYLRQHSELCNEQGIKTRTIAAELGISAATGSKRADNGMPAVLDYRVMIAGSDN